MSKNSSEQSLSYKDAGVNIDAGNALVDEIKGVCKSTYRPEVLTNIGGFGGLFSLANKAYENPVLVSGTDGVGTKLKLAQQLNKHDSIGIDLVAMCVNDIIVSGAEPLFFLDYFATSELNVPQAADVVKGIGEGCRQAGCALIGGETAEMPGMYQKEDYDLAGFVVGIVDEKKIIDGAKVRAGDVILGLPSSGPHSNGYSLIRKILEVTQSDLSQSFAGSTLGETLLTPTKIYVKSLLNLIRKVDIKAMAHITGGGLLENIPRILPDNTQAHITQANWQWPEIFTWLQTMGNVETQEMYRTFNCGIGMVLIVNENDVQVAQDTLTALGETSWVIGSIEASSETKPHVVIS